MSLGKYHYYSPTSTSLNTGLELGRYFLPMKSLKVNPYIQFKNLNKMWTRKPIRINVDKGITTKNENNDETGYFL